jgi:hypothetical protein
MKKAMPMTVWVLLTLGLTGCATTVVPNAGKVTLEEALESVGAGLVRMKKRQLEETGGKDFSTGLVPSEAEVTFNISASGNQDGKLYIEASPIPSSGVKVGASAGTAYTATRGNQVTIKFKSLVFGTKTTDPKGVVTVEGFTDPNDLQAIAQKLQDLGWPIYQMQQMK